MPDYQATQTDVRPMGAPPPLTVSPSQPRGMTAAQRLAAKPINMTQHNQPGPKVLGGAASASAMAGQIKAEQLAAGAKGPLRPSQQMLIWANMDRQAARRDQDVQAAPAAGQQPVAGEGGYKAVQAEHKQAVFDWMNRNLRETHLEMGHGTKALVGITALAMPAGFLTYDIHKAVKEWDKLGTARELYKHAPTKGIEDFKSDIAAVAGLLGDSAGATVLTTAADVAGTVWGVMSEVIENLPLIGSLYNIAKGAGMGVSVVLDMVRRVSASRRLKTSCSAIEKLALDAAVAGYTAEIIEDSTAMCQSFLAAAKEVSAGITGLLASATGAVKLLIKTILLVVRGVRSFAANKKIAEGQIDEALLQEFPTLALTLPHLPGVGALELLGVLPLGYADDYAGLKRLRQRAKRPEDSWLLDSLAQLDVFSTEPAALSHPWKADFQRVMHLMADTNYHLFEQNFVLVDKAGKPLYEAPPMNAWQAFKRSAKDKAKAAALTTYETLGPPIALLMNKVSVLFKAIGGELGYLISSASVGIVEMIRAAVVKLKGKDMRIHPGEPPPGPSGDLAAPRQALHEAAPLEDGAPPADGLRPAAALTPEESAAVLMHYIYGDLTVADVESDEEGDHAT